MTFQTLIDKLAHANDYLFEVRGALTAGSDYNLARELAQAIDKIDNVKRAVEGSCETTTWNDPTWRDGV